MQVVAVQIDMVWQDKPANHRKVRELLTDAKPEPGSLLVLPEMFDTGFSMQLAATAQIDATRESEVFLKQLAREFDVAVLAGVVGPVEAGVGKNEAVAFAPDGQELVRYRKMQPFTLSGEDQKYGFGDGHKIFEWQGVKVAPFVCYDLRFPELFRPAALDGAELIVVMACWPEVRSEHWVRLLQARAIENQAYAIGVNRCGSDPTLRYDGRSTGFDALGEQLFELNAMEQSHCVEVDVESVRRWRAKFPALRDIRHGQFA